MATEMAYRWKPGVSVPVSAQVAGEEITRIRDARGAFFTPASVVEASRAKTSPLHVAFEWNNKAAGAAWREAQASHLIRNIVVVVVQDASDDDAPPVRAFVSVKPSHDEKAQYTTSAHAFSVPDLREQVLARALADMQAFERRYSAYLDLSMVMVAFKASIARASVAQEVREAA